MTQATTREAMHVFFMQRAIELARRGWYSTRPNPRVGCVIAHGERVIGEGWHERAGEEHAERRAMADVSRQGENARGATAYVTLEPCSHNGRTPPCTDVLIEAGLARVVVGAGDPNPAVDGRGVARLREAGIDVVEGVAVERCAALNPGFNQRMRAGRPWVRVKLAMSLDGRTAAANGESRWITGDAAREDVHRLRAESGAVMVGSGTQRADDPALTVRLAGEWTQPLRVVLDTHLGTAPTARMLTLDGETLIFTASEDSDRTMALESAGARVERIDTQGASLDLAKVMNVLAASEINDVLVEAGPTLAGALAVADLVDEYVIYMAPTLIGDAGRGLVHLAGVEQLAGVRALTIDAIDPVGDDWRITARPRTKGKR